LIALVVIACPAGYATLACDLGARDQTTVADAGPTDKGKPDKDCGKRTDGQRSSDKPCSDGGERLPQDRRHSPLDSLPPLAPLVA
jgi:hypothetical protein